MATRLLTAVVVAPPRTLHLSDRYKAALLRASLEQAAGFTVTTNGGLYGERNNLVEGKGFLYRDELSTSGRAPIHKYRLFVARVSSTSFCSFGVFGDNSEAAYTRAFPYARSGARRFNFQWSAMGPFTRRVARASNAAQTLEPARTRAFIMTLASLPGIRFNGSLHTGVRLRAHAGPAAISVITFSWG